MRIARSVAYRLFWPLVSREYNDGGLRLSCGGEWSREGCGQWFVHEYFRRGKGTGLCVGVLSRVVGEGGVDT